MIPHGFAVIAGKDDHGILELSGCLKALHDAIELVINLLDHGIIIRLHLKGIMAFRGQRITLKVDGCEAAL